MPKEEKEINSNVLELSDEEFANLDFDAFDNTNENTEENVESEETDNNEEATIEAKEEDTVEEEEKEEEEEEEEETDEGSVDNEEASIESEEAEEVTTETQDVTDPEEKTTSKKVKDEVTVDIEAEHKQIFAPFKANGKEIQAKSVEDVISLMQMGANYNKRMAQLKPNLKILKLLENNSLLNEEKLSYLIDLDKKNPAAIEKLIKDSGIDPIQLDQDNPTPYTPNTYNVDDKSIELDHVLGEIQGSEAYNTTLDIIGNKWDVASRNVLVANPETIKVINAHVESGIYDQVAKVVENERMFGRLKGMSDLEAYEHVGNAINDNGGFAPKEQKSTSSILDKAVTDAKQTAMKTKLKSRKKAASSTKTVSKSASTNINPLSLSDEEFEKLSADKFM